MASTIIYANQSKDFSLWDTHKDVLKELFLTQKKPLKEVKQLMESNHGFPRNFTLSTYETTLRDHLGFRKNLKREDWEAIATHLEKRQGKESEVVFRGEPLAHKRVAKEIDRYCPKAANITIPTRATPPLPASIVIRSPPPASLEAVSDSQSSINDDGRVLGLEYNSARTYSNTTIGRDIIESSANLIPDIQHELSYLLRERYLRARMNLPINTFAKKIIEALADESRHHVTEDMLRSLASLHQMTGSPKVFGLNTSISILVNASYMLSNEYLDWKFGFPFLRWFEKVADMQLLRRFFSQNTPTTIASWKSLIKLNDSMYRMLPESRDAVATIWIEVGLTASEGKLMKGNAIGLLHVLRRMELPQRWKMWKRISPFGHKLFGGQWPECESQMLGDLLRRSIFDNYPFSIEDALDSGNSLPRTINLSGPNTVLDAVNMDCMKMLVEAGVRFEFDPVFCYIDLLRHLPYLPDQHCKKPWLAKLDRMAEFVDFCTGGLEECVTVFGICAAANRGLECLSEYLQSKPHPVQSNDKIPVPTTKTVLLQLALSKTTKMRLRSIVEVLLQYGVDIEVKALGRTGPRGGPRPALQAVWAGDVGMIALLAKHGADFNNQDILYAVKDSAMDESEEIDPSTKFEALVDQLVDAGLSLQQHGPPTMLRAVGLLDRTGDAPADVFIKVLQKYGVTWDESFFNNGKHWKGWDWSNEEVRGMDLLHAALRMRATFKTFQYLLDNGIQVHSGLCELDGKSMLHVALTSGPSDEQLEIARTLIDHLGMNIKTDPVWPSLLTLSMIDHPLKSDLEFFYYAKSLGATLPLPTNTVKAMQRFSLIPKLLVANAQVGTVREVWNHGEGFEQLHDEDRDRLLLYTIRAKAFSWAHILIEHGANINGEAYFDKYDWEIARTSTPFRYACEYGDCPLQFIRYLLELGGSTKFAGTTGLTAMHFAAFDGKLNLASLILEYDADVNTVWTPDDLQRVYHDWKLQWKTEWIQPMFTPLDMASAVGRLDMVKFLLNIGGRSAIPGLTGFDGALELARKRDCPGIVMLLNEAINNTNERASRIRNRSSPSRGHRPHHQFPPHDPWIPSKHHATRYSAISSRWQQAVEPRTFREVCLRSTQLDALACVLTPRRCRYVERIYFTVVIPSSDPDMQPAEQKAHLCKVMTGAFRRLFQILAEKSHPSDGGMMMLQVANVEFPEYVEPTSPRPFYQRDALNLVDWEDLPVVPCISELVLHEHQGERRVSLPTDLQLGLRLPNLPRITLGTFHWSGAGVRIMPRVDAVRSWRHELAAAFADERLLAWACPGKEGHVPPCYCVAAAASPDNGANAPPQHYEPLGAAIRSWSQNLRILEISGVFDWSLFWPSEVEPTRSAPGAAAFPHWPDLETFTTELSPCSSDGTCYFIRDPDAARVVIYAGREISLPPVGQPHDGTLQPLLASWPRALAQMPRLGGLRWNFCARWRGAGSRGWSWWFWV
ncbi:hypothetical protein PG996_003183 [Apiospora saccharicola]|uniref:Clr5 domain-containing protein n=1 Tax=Apiospora saccharicola TaxID=335842 RepID=A0ABR1W4E0_9PEZI